MTTAAPSLGEFLVTLKGIESESWLKFTRQVTRLNDWSMPCVTPLDEDKRLLFLQTTLQIHEYCVSPTESYLFFFFN